MDIPGIFQRYSRDIPGIFQGCSRDIPVQKRQHQSKSFPIPGARREQREAKSWFGSLLSLGKSQSLIYNQSEINAPRPSQSLGQQGKEKEVRREGKIPKSWPGQIQQSFASHLENLSAHLGKALDKQFWDNEESSRKNKVVWFL